MRRCRLLDRWPAALAIVAVLAATNSPASAKDYAYQSPVVETAKVNESGTRHDADRTDCIDAPSGELIKQVSVRTQMPVKEDADQASCTPSFQEYVEFIPGIREPRRVCLRSAVTSVGGIFNFGKRGRVKCSMTYSTHEGIAQPIDAAAGSPKGVDASSAIAMLPASVDLQREKFALVTARVPLATLQFSIDKAVADSKQTGLPDGFSVKVMSSRFEGVETGSFNLAYYVDVDVSGPIGARCEVFARFAIPAADVRSLLVQDIGSTANCKTGSLIGQLANLPTRLSNAIRAAITGAIGNQVFKDGNTFDDWAKQDPEWALVVLRGIVQGSYCDWRGQGALCLRLGWPNRREIDLREESLLARVPAKAGPIDVASAQAKLKFFLDDAMSNRRLEVNGAKHPTGRHADGSIEDGDMAIFGGLLCRSGEKAGCDLLRAVRTSDGRFWRSPRRVNEADTTDHSSFSGDQLKGVLHYLTAERDVKALEEFLRYLRSKPTVVPDASMPLESGYSTCPNYYPNFTCLVAGGDWFVLKLLAAKHGLTSLLPPDLPGIEGRYGFSYDTLLWESLMINNGYRLHLIANAAWLLRSLGQDDPRLRQVFRILAAREPANPFFLYLLNGSDRSVQAAADQKCEDPKSRTEFSDWAWQRGESDRAWTRSMVWDCVFIYGLLTRDPIPAN